MKGHERPAQAPGGPRHTQACDETQGAEGTWRQRTHLLNFRRQEVSHEGETQQNQLLEAADGQAIQAGTREPEEACIR